MRKRGERFSPMQFRSLFFVLIHLVGIASLVSCSWRKSGEGSGSPPAVYTHPALFHIDRQGRSERDRDPEWIGRRCLVRVWNRSRFVCSGIDSPHANPTHYNAPSFPGSGLGIASVHNVLLPGCREEPVRDAER